MEFVFPALERRFNRDGQLRKLARKLYHGSNENTRTPRDYVEVVAKAIHNDFDTFLTTEPVYSLTFRVVTKSLGKADRCSAIMRHLKRVFADCDLQSGNFGTSGMRTTGDVGPQLVDGLYEGEVSFDLQVTIKTPIPSERMTA